MEWVVSKKSNELRVMSTARVLVLIGQLADLLKKKKKKSVTRITFLCLSCLIWEMKRFELCCLRSPLGLPLFDSKTKVPGKLFEGRYSLCSFHFPFGPVHCAPRAAEGTNRGARHKEPTKPHHLTLRCLGSDFFLSPSNFTGHFLSFSHLCIFPISHLLLYGNMCSFMSSLKRLIKIAFPIKKKKKRASA